MFNFSANHQRLVSKINYNKCNVFILQDIDTKRCYKVYDYSKTFELTPNKVYCISGKINSTDKLYLILETCKEDLKYKTISIS